MQILKAIGELLIAVGIAGLLVGLGRLFAPGPRSARSGPTTELDVLAEQAFRIIEAHPEGITLVAIGEELGIDWRQLIAPVNLLLAEGRVEKRERRYFPR
ncbi:MAG: hypothetical protein ACE5LQ_01260 [Candidatus Bipolaricaulia bacterium]